MRWLRDISIRHKVTLLVMSTVVAALLVSITGLFLEELAGARKGLVERMYIRAEIVGANTISALLFNDPEPAERTLATLKSAPHLRAAVIYTREGLIFATFERERDLLPERPEKDGHEFRFSQMRLFHPILHEGERVGTIGLISETAELRENFVAYITTASLLLLLGAVGAFFIASRFQRLVTGSILALAETARAVAERKDVSLRATAAGGDEVGQLVGQFNQMLDTLERSRELQRKLSQSVKQAADIIYITDRDGVIEYVNPAFERETGYTAAESIGQKSNLLRSGAHDAAFYKNLWETILAGRLYRGVVINKRKDGTLYYEEKIIAPLQGEDGRSTHFVSTGRDITERLRRAEEVQRLNAELEQRVADRTADLARVNVELEVANKELEAFSYTVAHDLRGPARVMGGFAKMLGQRFGDKLDDTGREFIDLIMGGSKRMGQLIDDLLAFARTGRCEIKHASVNLSLMAEEIISDLRREEPERTVEVIIAPALMAHGDPGLLRQVLANLLGNAWKYSCKQPQARIEFGRTEHGGKAAWFVRDNGAGFDMAYYNKLFCVFQRLHGVEEFEGTGVGLASVARILQRHHGEIWAEAAVGKGATFYFTLPPAETASIPAAA